MQGGRRGCNMTRPQCLHAEADGACSAKYRVDGTLFVKCAHCEWRRESAPLRLPESVHPQCLHAQADGKCSAHYRNSGALYTKCVTCAWRSEDAQDKPCAVSRPEVRHISKRCKACRYWRRVNGYYGDMVCNFMLDEHRMRGCEPGDACTCYRPKKQTRHKAHALTVCPR